MEKPIKTNFNHKYVVAQRNDPRILGYYYDEATLTVLGVFDTIEQAKQEYRKKRNDLSAFEGNTGMLSIDYPVTLDLFKSNHYNKEIKNDKTLEETGCEIVLFKGNPKYAGRQFTDDYDSDFENFDEWKDYQNEY